MRFEPLEPRVIADMSLLSATAYDVLIGWANLPIDAGSTFSLYRSADGADAQLLCEIDDSQTDGSFDDGAVLPGHSYAYFFAEDPGDGVSVTLDGAIQITSATAVVGTRVALAWTDPHAGDSEYVAVRNDDGGFDTLAGGAAPDTGYGSATVTAPGPDAWYTFAVGNSYGLTVTDVYTGPNAPAAATAYTLNATTGAVGLSWSNDAANDGSESFGVYRGGSTADFPTDAAHHLADVMASGSPGGSFTYTDQLTPGTHALTYYKLVATNGNGTPSDPTTVPYDTRLPAPAGISAMHNFTTDNVDLTWTHAAGGVAQTYVERSDDNGQTWQGLAAVPVTPHVSTSSYSDATVVAGTRPLYRLTCEDAAGSGASLASTGVPSSPVAAGPTITTNAAASPATLNGTTTSTFSATASESGASSLSYTWSVVSEPAGAADPDVAGNGAISAASGVATSATATFYQAGTYVMQVQASDGLLLSNASNVTVHVNQGLSSVTLTPSAGVTAPGGVYRLHAVALDQFGLTMTSQPSIAWSATAGTVTTGSGGLGTFTAPASGAGPYTVTVHPSSNSAITATATVSATANSAPTVVPQPVTDLIASAGQDGDAQLGWNNPTSGAAADGYLISASADNGATYTPLGVAPAGSTVYLATNLVGGAPYLFRVTPYDAAGYGTAATTTAAVTPGGYANLDWYKVSFAADPSATSEAFTSGCSAAYDDVGSLSLTTAAQANGGWVQAASSAQAVQLALTGSVARSYGGFPLDPFTFGTSGAFQYNPDLVLPDGTDVGPAVVLEDQFDASGHGDANFTDAYVPLNVTNGEITVDATADQTAYPVPTGSTLVGLFNSLDPRSAAADFTAVVTWGDGSTSNGTVVDAGNGNMAVAVAGTSFGSALANYTLAVTHTATGLSGASSVGTGGGGAGGGVPNPPGSSGGIVRPAHRRQLVATITQVSLTFGSDPVTAAVGAGASKVQPGDGTLPARETVKWTWNGTPPPHGFKVQYTTDPSNAGSWQQWSPSASDPNAVSRVRSSHANIYYCTANVPVSDLNGVYVYVGPDGYLHDAAEQDPKPCFFRVSAVNGTGLASATACAPQIYFTWGNEGAASGNGLLFAKVFDNELGAQVHAFSWDHVGTTGPADLENDVEDPHAPKPVILFGQSFGGSEAVKIAKDIGTAAGIHTSYLALFDPVTNYNVTSADDCFLDNGDQVGNAPRANDPVGYNAYPSGQMPQSHFTLPASVDAADDWWQQYDVEWDYQVNVLGFTDTDPKSPRAPKGTPTGNVNVAKDDHPHTGDYHTAQDDEVSVLTQTVLPQVKTKVASLTAASSAWPWLAR